MKLQRITSVRFTEEQGRGLLEKYLFRGMYGGPRVPRGIDPNLVAKLLDEQLKPDSSPNAYSRILQVVRFYETTPIVPKARQLLSGSVTDADSMRRKLYAVQMVGELGTPDDVTAAAGYFDNTLVGHPLLASDLRLPLAALESLSPAGSSPKLLGRIRNEVTAREKKQRDSEKDMMDYDRFAAILRNDWPKANLSVQAKSKLASQPPDQRRADLVKMYLGQLAGSDDVTEIWAARMLRLEALTTDAVPAQVEFAKVLDATDPAKVESEPAASTVARAGQAIIYLQGTLTAPQRNKFARAKGAANFLWDDP